MEGVDIFRLRWFAAPDLTLARLGGRESRFAGLWVTKQERLLALLSRGDLVADAFAGDVPLELGERQKHIQGQPSHAGGGVELLGDRHKRDAAAVKDLDELGKIRERASQPVDLIDDDHIDSGLPRYRLSGFPN
jgi:hypothetical protein